MSELKINIEFGLKKLKKYLESLFSVLEGLRRKIEKAIEEVKEINFLNFAANCEYLKVEEVEATPATSHLAGKLTPQAVKVRCTHSKNAKNEGEDRCKEENCPIY